MSENKNQESVDDSLEISAKSVKKTFDLYTSLAVENKTEDQEVTFVRGQEGTIGSLKPELQNSLKEVRSSVDKEVVSKLLNRDKEKDMSLFKSDNVSDEHTNSIVKKLSKWESTKEINQANATVVAAWMNKYKTT